MTHLTLKRSKLLIKSFSALFLFTVFAGQALAEDDFAAEGERRAKLAGSELLGTPAPQRQLTTLAGETLNLGELYGNKPVYIKFWATWCVPCRQQMPGFEEIYQQYGDKLQVISVNTGISDDINSVSAFIKKEGLTMPVTIDDGSLARAFKLRVTPQHFLIDKSGRIAYVGHQDDEAFHQALEEVASGSVADAAPLSGVVAERVSGYQLGDKLASLALRSIDDTYHPLPSSDQQGKATGLVFFSPWCEWYLVDSEPETAKSCQLVREMVEQSASNSKTQWLHVSTNLWASQAELAQYQTNYHTRLPIVFDEEGTLFGRFGVTQLPTIVYIDESGRITEKVSAKAADFIDRLKSLFNKQ
ncbi:redoxin domain-containing protein [Shewanella sp. Isolate8]|uniref:redoxin domain-containing protein n=1 Tax=Shewanella sp. Isolate8 TaxID=2908529 RepID=UPI001EFCD1D7|nr:redoxin domain-containing protein [Shewanella sp. Isolate8]MCG9747303.1 redoxin domain-containing protein [Shewanella sp. Isolate8]